MSLSRCLSLWPAIICLVLLQPLAFVSMDNHNTNDIREWHVLSQNIRGINSDKKWNSIRNKIRVGEEGCDSISVPRDRGRRRREELPQVQLGLAGEVLWRLLDGEQMENDLSSNQLTASRVRE
jgi:hypothetical protein